MSFKILKVTGPNAFIEFLKQNGHICFYNLIDFLTFLSKMVPLHLASFTFSEKGPITSSLIRLIRKRSHYV